MNTDPHNYQNTILVSCENVKISFVKISNN